MTKVKCKQIYGNNKKHREYTDRIQRVIGVRMCIASRLKDLLKKCWSPLIPGPVLTLAIPGQRIVSREY